MTGPEDAPVSTDKAIDQAWKIHSSQVDWTGKVDAKASFAFTIESALLGVTIALSAANRIFASMPSGPPSVLYWVGVPLLTAGMLCALVAVFPRLKAREALKAAPHNFIYFGHARHWDANNLAQALTDRDLLPVITRQIVVMADVAWDKHRWVQASMALAGIGSVCLGTAGLMLASLHH